MECTLSEMSSNNPVPEIFVKTQTAFHDLPNSDFSVAW